ncbi:pyridoxamine 5'-phosphate oxidase family protein [Pseudonocardia endophytica]|uniref:Pyridoxamine 5'-phosphate oxidase N-terminal domain-containing protein n=1 Tax=Pseudonocardia endophytica TaxID=401976 RepID=A0A4R1HYN7_PSEEN|nr:pyridoxamine 5'-phosphate oxidase family protein [Pseudonocardia endophytica]TCK25990.1 hypothetical protein EV378_1817 [Pseudonocardia endophytica]
MDVRTDHVVRTQAELREIVGDSHPAVWLKEAPRVDDVAAAFVAASPLVFVGTSGPDGAVTVTPRGGEPGSVRVLDDGRRLALAERPGNRRVDTLRNVLENPAVGLAFCVPTVLHVLRVHGTARIVTDPDVLGLWDDPPPLALVVDVDDTYVHCGRALKMSGVWEPDGWGNADGVPGLKRMADAARATRPDAG